jgi:hypothetical protein
MPNAKAAAIRYAREIGHHVDGIHGRHWAITSVVGVAATARRPSE